MRKRYAPCIFRIFHSFDWWNSICHMLCSSLILIDTDKMEQSHKHCRRSRRCSDGEDITVPIAVVSSNELIKICWFYISGRGRAGRRVRWEFRVQGSRSKKRGAVHGEEVRISHTSHRVSCCSLPPSSLHNRFSEIGLKVGGRTGGEEAGHWGWRVLLQPFDKEQGLCQGRACPLVY